jgi:hypothetical protein
MRCNGIGAYAQIITFAGENAPDIWRTSDRDRLKMKHEQHVDGSDFAACHQVEIALEQTTNEYISPVPAPPVDKTLTRGAGRHLGGNNG